MDQAGYSNKTDPIVGKLSNFVTEFTDQNNKNCPIVALDSPMMQDFMNALSISHPQISATDEKDTKHTTTTEVRTGYTGKKVSRKQANTLRHQLATSVCHHELTTNILSPYIEQRD